MARPPSTPPIHRRPLPASPTRSAAMTQATSSARTSTFGPVRAARPAKRDLDPSEEWRPAPKTVKHWVSLAQQRRRRLVWFEEGLAGSVRDVYAAIAGGAGTGGSRAQREE